VSGLWKRHLSQENRKATRDVLSIVVWKDLKLFILGLHMVCEIVRVTDIFNSSEIEQRP
jgi:hypothetical protein